MYPIGKMYAFTERKRGIDNIPDRWAVCLYRKRYAFICLSLFYSLSCFFWPTLRDMHRDNCQSEKKYMVFLVKQKIIKTLVILSKLRLQRTQKKV